MIPFAALSSRFSYCSAEQADWPHKLAILLLLSILVLAGCQGDDGGSGSDNNDGGSDSDNNDGDNQPQTVIKDNVAVIDDSDTTKELAQVSGDGKTLTFSGTDTQFNDLDEGDYFALEPNDKAPYGMLRQIVNTKTENGNTVVETERATLTDVVEKGSLSESGTLEPPTDTVNAASQNTTAGGNGLRVLSKMEGVRLVPRAGNASTAAIESPNTLPFSLQLNDVVLYDDDGNPATKADQVVANGTIGFSIDYDIEFDIDDSEIQNFRFAMMPTEISELNLSSGVDVDFEKTQTLWSAQMPTIKFAIGWWPIWVTPEIDVNVTGEGEISASLTSGATGKITATVGVEYDNEQSDPWTPITERSSEFEVMPVEVNTNASATVAAGPVLQFLIYSVAGPQANLDAYLTLNADILDDPWWRLLGGIRAGAGAKIEILGETIASANFPDIIDYQIELAKAESGVLPVPTAPGNVSVQPGDGHNNLSWDSVEDASQYNLYWSSTAGVVPGSTGVEAIEEVTSPYVHDGLTNGQAHHYVVTAENASGESQSSQEVSATPKADEDSIDDGDSGDDNNGDGDSNEEQTDTDITEGLVLHYPFNGDAEDASGNDLHASLENGADLGQGRNGDDDQALMVDGNDEYAVSQRSDLLRTPKKFTVSAWIKISSDFDEKSSRAIAAQGTYYDTTGNWQFFVTEEKGLVLSLNNSGSWEGGTDPGSVRMGSSIPIDQWTHVAATFDHSEVSLYVDGQLERTGTLGATAFRNTNDAIKIGEREYSSAENDFEGGIDDFRLYDRALSKEEVASLSEAENSTSEEVWQLTTDQYRFDVDHGAVCQEEFGDDYEVAEWNDLSQQNLDDFFDAVGATDRGSIGFMTRGGEQFHTSSRSYLVARHDGDVGTGWLVHDDIDNNRASLGSWYTSRQVVCKKISEGRQ